MKIGFSQLRSAVASRVNRQTLRAGGLLMLANLIVTGLGLVRTPVMTWVLPKEGIGMIGVVAAWTPFLQLLSLPGLDSAAYHYVSKGDLWAFVTNLSYRLRWSLLSAAGLLAAAGYWAWKGQAELAWLFVIAGLSFPLTSGLSATAGMISAQEKFSGLFWYRIWESLTDFAGFLPLVFSAWWISKTATFYAGNQIATAIMQVLVSYWLVNELRHAKTTRMQPDSQAEMIRYGSHLTVISAISLLQARSDAILVGALLPLQTMADYSIATLVAEQMRRLWNIYLTMRYPPLARMPLPQRKRRFWVEGAGVLLGFIAAGLAVSFAGHLLIPLVLPPSYRSSLGYIDLLLAAMVASIPGWLAETYFRTIQDERKQYLLRIVGALVSLAAPAFFVIRWAAYGAAAGRIVASFCLSAFGIWLLIRDRSDR